MLQKHQETLHGGVGSKVREKGTFPGKSTTKNQEEKEIKMTEMTVCSGVGVCVRERERETEGERERNDVVVLVWNAMVVLVCHSS